MSSGGDLLFSLTSDRLRVNTKTGKCIWRVAPKGHPRLLGLEAGCERAGRDGKNYWVIKINGRPIKRAAIVFAISNGQWPDRIVDHKNGNSLDDGAQNLRLATKRQNNHNRKGTKKSSDLPMGVRFIHGRFNARCTGKSLGMFDTVDAAHAAYKQARIFFFGEFA